VKIEDNYPLSRLTSLRVGGQARYFSLAQNEEDLLSLSFWTKEKNIPVFFMGGGTNLLVSDEGWPGLVLKLGQGFSWLSHEGSLIRAGASTPSHQLSRFAQDKGQGGLEFFVGIPGTIGGAVFGNAGAYGGETGKVVHEVMVWDIGRGSKTKILRNEIQFSYRRSSFPEFHIITEVAFGPLTSMSRSEIDEKMRKLISERRKKEPPYRSCGSLFKNPPGSRKAWELVHEAGLAGLKEGGAMVALKHANYIINLRTATARDVYVLIRKIKEKIKERFGIALEPEVRFLGPFDDA